MSSDDLLRLRGGLSLTETEGIVSLASPRERWSVRIRGSDSKSLKRALDLLLLGVTASQAAVELAEISHLPEPKCRTLLDALEARGALITSRDRAYGLSEDGRRAHSTDLYDRQIRFLDHFERTDADGRTLNHLLQNRKVVIVGLGGGGGWTALQCARVGIRTIVGVDHDVVEKSNLNRQVLYDLSDVGRFKADRWTRRVTEVDPEIVAISHPICIRAPGDLVPLLKGADLVFNEFAYLNRDIDPLNTGESIARASLDADVPCIAVSGSWVGPITVPGKTACLGCVRAQLDVDRSIGLSNAKIKGYAGTLAPRPLISCAVTVWEACRFLSTLDSPPTLAGIAVLDTLDYVRHDFIRLQRLADCSWCRSYGSRNTQGGRAEREWEERECG